MVIYFKLDVIFLNLDNEYLRKEKYQFQERVFQYIGTEVQGVKIERKHFGRLIQQIRISALKGG